MPHPKTTPLQAAAAKAEDAKAKRKKLGLLASIASALGLSDTDAKPAGRMSKRTETTKHTIVEEDDGDAEEEDDDDSAAEEEEAEDSSTDMTESSAAEEEEEDSASDAEEEERAEDDSEEKAARAIAKAYKSDAVRDAFLKAVPEKHRASAALRSPARLFREVKRATAAKSIDDAMVSLSRRSRSEGKRKASAPAAETIRANAKVEAKIARLETDGRRQRVNAIVDKAKGEGRAASKDLREQLRAYGMANGSKALRAFVATLPVAARATPRIPRQDERGNPIGAPTADAQRMEQQMFGHLPPDEREKAIAESRALYAKRFNAAGGDA